MDPRVEEISSVLEHWHERCKASSPRVKIPLDGSRAKAVGNMLKVYDAYQLKRAVDGAAAFPYMGMYGKRYCEAGDGRQRKDDIEFICRDERHVEAFMALADGDEHHKAYRRHVFELCKRHPLIVAALAMLAGEDPHGEVLARAAIWAKQQEAGDAA